MTNPEYIPFTGELDATPEYEPFTGKLDGEEKDGAFVRGLKRAKQSATITTQLATGDTAGTANTIRDAELYNRQNPSSKESDELSAAWEKGDGITGGIAAVGQEFAKDWRESKGFIGGLRETGKNVNALREGIVSQLGNSVAPMVGLAAGATAGAAAGSAVPLVGNIAGGLAGGWAGAAAGNTLVEGGGQLQTALQKAGIDPMDTVAVEKFVAENGNQILGQSAIKGGIIGAVDTATAGIAGRLLNVPARAAVNRALVDMGVDVADKIAVKEAMKNSAAEISSRLASDTAYQASRTGAENIARNAGAAALDPAGEFTGEYVGQGAATGDWNTKNAALEALSSVGQSGAMFAGQKGYQALTNPFRNGKTGEAAPQSNTPITDAAQATGAFPQLPAPSITVNADGTAETTEDRNARIAARAAGDIADVTPIPNTPEYQDVRGFAPAARQTQALEAPTITVDGNGQALTAQDRNNRLSDRLSGGVTDVTPIQRAPEVIPPSRAMGLNPANGSLSGAAAMAVDSGASVFGSISQQGALNGQQTQEAQQAGEGQSQGGRASGAAPKTRAVKTLSGETVIVNESDLTSGAKSLRTFTSDGKPRAARLDAANIAPPPPKVVLQNRDRSTSASIQQMNNIVAKPDFLKAGTSSTMDRGAPMVFGDLPSKSVVGRPQQVADDNGKRIPTNYAVVEADDLVASNHFDGTTNNDYANGVEGKLRAVAGNGRVAGLQEAWNRGTTGEYAADLAQEAENLGIDPQALAGFSRPVLVRVMDEADVTADIGDRSNIQAGLQLSALEKATNDTRRMDLRDMEFDDNGDPTADTMRSFVATMPVQERGDMLDSRGLPTVQLIDRIKAAAFKQAYMNDALVELATQAVNEDAKRVISALAMAAGDMVQLDGTGEFDIRQAVADAAGLAINAAKKREKLADYLKTRQVDESAEAIAVARFFAENSASANKIADGLRAWAELAKSQVEAAKANAEQSSMFGDTPTLSRNQLFERLSDENITEIEREQLIAKQERDQSTKQSVEPQSAERAGDADSTTDGAASSDEVQTEDFALNQQTPEEAQELEAEQLSREREIEAAKRKAEEADRAAQDRAEVTRRSEAAADNFELGQNAEDSLSGQGDIFAAAQEPAKAEATAPVAPVEEAKPAPVEAAKPKNLKEGLAAARAKMAEGVIEIATLEAENAVKRAEDRLTRLKAGLAEFENKGASKALLKEERQQIQRQEEEIANLKKIAAGITTQNDADGYSYQIDTHNGHMVTFIKPANMAGFRTWSEDKEGAQEKIEAAKQLHKNSEHLSKRWVGERGAVTDVSLHSFATMGDGTDNYRVTYQDGFSFLVDADKFQKKMEEDIFAGSPDGKAEKAKKEAQREVDRKEDEEIKALKEKLAQKAADKKAAVTAAIDQWLDATDKTPMQRGLITKFLMAEVLYKKVSAIPITKAEFVQHKVYEGAVAGSFEEDKVKPLTRMQDFRADKATQEAHEQRIKEAGKKTVYTVGDIPVTKAEYEYAKHIIANRDTFKFIFGGEAGQTTIPRQYQADTASDAYKRGFSAGKGGFLSETPPEFKRSSKKEADYADGWIAGSKQWVKVESQPIEVNVEKPIDERDSLLSNELADQKSKVTAAKSKFGENSTEASAEDKKLRSMRSEIFKAEDNLDLAKTGDKAAIEKIAASGFTKTAEALSKPSDTNTNAADNAFEYPSQSANTSDALYAVQKTAVDFLNGKAKIEDLVTAASQALRDGVDISQIYGAFMRTQSFTMGHGEQAVRAASPEMNQAVDILSDKKITDKKAIQQVSALNLPQTQLEAALDVAGNRAFSDEQVKEMVGKNLPKTGANQNTRPAKWRSDKIHATLTAKSLGIKIPKNSTTVELVKLIDAHDAKVKAKDTAQTPVEGKEDVLRVGIMPNTAEVVTVKDGVVFIGKHEALDFDSGEPVTVPKGSTPAQIADALEASGALSSKQRVFGSGRSAVDAEATAADSGKTKALTAQPEAKPTASAKEAAPALTPTQIAIDPIEAANPSLTDFGEKLGGARKDMVRTPIQDGATANDFATQPLSKIWPSNAHEKVESKQFAAFMFAARGLIPSRPRTGYKLRHWADKAQAIYELVSGIDAIARLPIERVMEHIRAGKITMGGFADRFEILTLIDRENWSRVGSVEIFKDAYRFENGVRVPSSYAYYEVDGKRYLSANVDPGSSIKSVADLLPMVQEKLVGEAEAKKLAFEIRQNTRDKIYFINKVGDKSYHRLHSFNTLAEAREFLKDNYEKVVASWDAIKSDENVRKEDVRKSDNAPRSGRDWREGKDATPEGFVQTFGFRGVEFGNWVSQGKGGKERQGMLNQAYDALMDLAEIIGQPPKALSLGGKLGLGFGSRGSGKASAHFEPNTVVINLTKTKGAGTLAHEWFHALDNYFRRQRGQFEGKDREDNYITYKPEADWVTKDGTRRAVAPMTSAELRQWLSRRFDGYDANKPLEENAEAANFERDKKHPNGVRPEVEQSFVELTDALDKSPMAARAAKLDKTPNGYWGRIIERAARSFENYVIAKMTDSGSSNDYLANVVDVKDFVRNVERFPYLRPEEVAPIKTAFDNLFATIQTKQDDAGNTVMFSRSKPTIRPVQQALIDAYAEMDGDFSGDEKEATARYEKASDNLATAQADLEADLAEVPDEGFAIRANSFGGKQVALTKSAKGDGWQLTRLDKNGEPWGDTAFKTKSQAIKYFIEEADIATIETSREVDSIDFRRNDKNDKAATQENTRRLESAKRLVGKLTAKWAKVPEIVIARNMGDSAIPNEVREHDAKLKSQGAIGEPQGFIYKGKVYLLSDQLATGKEVAETLFHEVLGHFGLRSVFGADLKKILSQVTLMRRKDVIAKAREYGLFDSESLGSKNAKAMSDAQVFAAMSQENKETAAEEVLAEMAQTSPEIGFVKQAIAAIRNWLRNNVPIFSSLKLTDADIIQGYLLPAKGFVERGKDGVSVVGNISFSRSNAEQTETPEFKKWFGDSKVVDADGKPLVVYHGTAEDVSRFDPERAGQEKYSDWGKGVYFTPSPSTADYYRGEAAEKRDTESNRLWALLEAEEKKTTWKNGAPTYTDEHTRLLGEWRSARATAENRAGSVMPVYLSIKNPLVQEYSSMPDPFLADRAKADGRDGIIVLNGNGGIDEIIAFRPNQIKSATGNNGNYSLDSDDINEFGTKPKAKDGKKGTTTDRAVMDMVREEKTADEVLNLIIATSRSRFNKQVARLLLKTGALPKLGMVADMGSSNGFKHMAKYSRKYNAISMTDAAEGQAEQIFLHEMVHAATLKALDRKNLASVQMRKLFDHVKKQGGASGQYGLKNVGEFVSEAFTNPDFQKALKGMSAPAQSPLHSAWDYLVKALKMILGLPNGSESALSAALEIGVAVMREDKVLRNRGVQGKGKDANAGIDQTQTPEFKRWFGDSKVVDADGKPLVVYHGSPSANIYAFDANREGDNTGAADNEHGLGGFYFTPDPNTAGTYARTHEVEFANIAEQELGIKPSSLLPNSTIYPVYLSIKNPLMVEDSAITKAVIDRARKGGHDGIIKSGSYPEYVVFRSEQVKSAIGNNGDFSTENDDIAFFGAAEEGAGTWQAPEATKFDQYTYLLQDKQIDSKRVVNAIKENGKQIADDLDVYLQETLFHGRAAKRVKDFAEQEELPLIELLRDKGLELAELEEYLHARHAPEANAEMSERNPNKAMIEERLKKAVENIAAVEVSLRRAPTDKNIRKEMLDAEAELSKWRNAKPYKGEESDRLALSGMSNEEAAAVMDSLDDDKRKNLQAAAKMVDRIIAKTRETIVDYGLESDDTVDAWSRSWNHYVPLMREQLDEVVMGGMGTGQGFSIKGKETKGRTGSTKKVVDILANINMQRERAIVRGEKNRVATALLGLVKDNPNKDFWRIAESGEIPSTQTIDKKTGLVITQIDPLFKSRDNALVVKVNGVEKVILFNEDNPRAMRMAVALKNMDAANLEGLLGNVASVTRYLAAVNTQYNPIFGVVNMVRDFQEAAINMQKTPLAGKQKQVLGNAPKAIWQIGMELRAQRKGEKTGSEYGSLWQEFQEQGGQTGYRDMFNNSAERSKELQNLLKPDAWADTEAGRFFTVNGALKVPLEILRKTALRPLLDLLSDYNEAIENGVRLSAYKAALDIGMSKPRAAELAKNLTVNFNRKGQVAQQVGALYAFFNASVQGTARMGQTLFDMEPGQPKTLRLSSLGKKILGGGILLGSAQAMMLAAAGFGDDEPPEFIRQRNLIIPNPFSGKGYTSIPMPLGYHVLTNLGRIPTEYALSGFKSGGKRAVGLVDVLADIYNPLGGSGLSLQTIAPSVIDPFAALAENKDFSGRPIAKQSFNKVTPGHALGRDTSSLMAQGMSQIINYATGGTEFTRGEVSPTPDQIDYLIGQVTGGVGREASKVSQTTQALATGQDLPWHKIPLVGRFYGDADSVSAKQSSYYNIMDGVRRHAAEVKGLRNEGRIAEAQAYIQENPEASMHIAANAAERQVKKLRDRMDDLKEQDAPRESIKELEDQMVSVMQRFDALVKSKQKP